MHLCNRCFQLFKTDEIFKRHQSDNLCFNLDLPNMEITLQTCIPANILKIFIESHGIGVLKLSSRYPSTNNNEPPSQSGFENFCREYQDQLYPDIEQISDDEEDEDKKKRRNK